MVRAAVAFQRTVSSIQYCGNMIQVTRASGSDVVRAAGVALLAGVLGGGLAACSGNNGGSSTTTTPAGAGSGTSATSGTSASSGASGSGTTSLPGAKPIAGSTNQATGTATPNVPGSEQVDAKITACTATKTGVRIEATVKNTTTGARTFVIAAKVRAGGKDAGGAAILAPAVKPGATIKASGETKTPVKGKPTCTIANVNGIDG